MDTFSFFDEKGWLFMTPMDIDMIPKYLATSLDFARDDLKNLF